MIERAESMTTDEARESLIRCGGLTAEGKLSDKYKGNEMDEIEKVLKSIDISGEWVTTSKGRFLYKNGQMTFVPNTQSGRDFHAWFKQTKLLKPRLRQILDAFCFAHASSLKTAELSLQFLLKHRGCKCFLCKLVSREIKDDLITAFRLRVEKAKKEVEDVVKSVETDIAYTEITVTLPKNKLGRFILRDGYIMDFDDSSAGERFRTWAEKTFSQFNNIKTDLICAAQTACENN